MPTLRDMAGRLGPLLIDPRVEDPASADRWQAAVALILRESGRGGADVLLIKRADNPRDHWSGHIALPGGRRDETDASLATTALRETREEVGIALGVDDIVGRLARLSPQNPRLPRIDITPFVVLADGSSEPTPNHEVAECFWVSLDELIVAGPTRVVHLEITGERLEWPAYPYREHLIWGLTERILTEFIALVQQIREVSGPHATV